MGNETWVRTQSCHVAPGITLSHPFKLSVICPGDRARVGLEEVLDHRDPGSAFRQANVDPLHKPAPRR